MSSLVFPEWIDREEGAWTVKPGRPQIDLDGKVLYLDDDAPRGIVAHELAHLAHSPKGRSLSIKDRYTNATEDCRINLWLRNVVGINPMEGYGDTAAVFARLVARKDYVDAVLCAVSIGQDSFEGMPRSTNNLVRSVVALLAPSGGHPAPFSRTLQLAAILREAFEETPEDILRDARKGLMEGAKVPGFGGFDEGCEELSADFAESLENSGAMSILAPPKPRDWRRVRYTRPSECGAVPRQFERYMVDRAVFRGLRRDFRRGTVLIDASGSMKLTPAHIGKFAQLFPFGTIAYYAGCDAEGTLVIAARNGRAIDEFHDCGRGNIVDAPALVWLTEQPAPRHWITDCGFTGRGDNVYLVKRTAIQKHAVAHGVKFHDSLLAFQASEGRPAPRD